MSSALVSQLGQIRVKSLNSLNLKAQKKAHSQSLLFEPSIAATQDFDTIYQLCHDGFRELCHLDSRFIRFSGTIFSEQSKKEDRTLMTESENVKLDTQLESFLDLVGSRLLLKPAIQAVEWIVRRFRVHEYNTTTLVMTLLPYHTQSVFSVMLSILPPTLPPVLKFLYPYIQSRSCPPRHTIIFTATHNEAFFAALSAYVLRICRRGFQYPALVSFWVTVNTEVTASVLDHARSGRREAQTKQQEDVVARVISTIHDALSIEGIADLRVGCYMIMTVLSSKAVLGEKALGLMMEAVVFEWTKTSHAGLICLSVMAQKRIANHLPERVFKALLELENLEDDLRILKKDYSVDKLVLGLVWGLMEVHRQVTDGTSNDKLCALIESDLLDSSSVTMTIKYIVVSVDEGSAKLSDVKELPTSTMALISRLSMSSKVGYILRDAVEHLVATNSPLRTGIHAIAVAELAPLAIEKDIHVSDVDTILATDSFDEAMGRIQSRAGGELTFLSPVEKYTFLELCEAFLLATKSPDDLGIFLNLPVLGRSQSAMKPLFISFFIRVWCSHRSAKAREAAIDVVCSHFADQDLTTDVQVLLPYIIYASSDSSRRVRQASMRLALSLASRYKSFCEDSSQSPRKAILGETQMYGHTKAPALLSWLSVEDVARFLDDFYKPNLEESLLDANHLPQSLAFSLIGDSQRSGSKAMKGLRSSLRQGIFGFLCSHVTVTPLWEVKLRLLPLLNQVRKVGSLTRTRALLPLYKEHAEMDEATFRDKCSEARIEPTQLIDALVATLAPADRDTLVALQNAIEPGVRSVAPLRNVAAFQRIRTTWSAMNSAFHTPLAEKLLELSVLEPKSVSAAAEQKDAAETLYAVELSSLIFEGFMESLPSLGNQFQDRSFAAKKRKLNHDQSPAVTTTPPAFRHALTKVTFVLELISASGPERHPQLLKGVFHVLADIKNYRSISGSGLGYLEVMTLNIASSVIHSSRNTSALHSDVSAIRADVLLEFVGSTGNPQVQQAALLLASHIADIAPELLLHNMMPIFTFASEGVMRNDDGFSVHVVEKTMATIIPHLVEALYKRKVDPITGVSELLLSFVAAYKDVSFQRRQNLFTSLSNLVGADDFLYALLVMLLDKYPDQESVIDFATKLAAQHDCRTQLLTVEKYFDFLLDYRMLKPSYSLHLLSKHENRQFEDTVANLLPLPASILRAEKLKEEVAQQLDDKENGSEIVRSRYGRILEKIFTFADGIKHNEKLKRPCARVVDAFLGLLSIGKFVEILPALLPITNDNIRHEILVAFEKRLKDHGFNRVSPHAACLAFLPYLVTLAGESKNSSLQQAAVACIDQVVERYGKKDITVVTAAAMAVSGSHCLESTDVRTRCSALLCLATMVEVLRDAFVPIVPQALSKALDHLALSVEEGVEDSRLHNAAYTFVTGMLLYLPWMIHGAYLDRLLNVSFESANAEMGHDSDQLRLDALRLVANSLDAKECYQALDRTWRTAVAQGPKAVNEYLEMLKRALERQPKPAVADQAELLATIFLKAFDLRRIQFSPRTDDSYEEHEVDEVEMAVNETLIAMIYKLNDNVFRPIFIRFSEWANSTSLKQSPRMLRQITWWKFQMTFFDTLKSIVTSYAGLILGDAVSVLEKASLEAPTSRVLWSKVLLTLESALKHDQDGYFQKPAHYTALCTVLLSQLSPCASWADGHLLPHLLSTITTLAASTDSPAQHRSLCTPLLHFMQDENPMVRLATVQCQLSLTERLGEEWLAQLPEMLPFISEGMEDNDERVELEVRRWIRRIEGILGESIHSMLH